MLGEILQELRNDKNLTQADLAKIVGVSTSSIGSYETQLVDPPLPMLIKLADYFNVTLDYLVGRTRTQFSWDELLKGFQVGEKRVTLDCFAEIISKMGAEERQAFFIIGKSLAASSALSRE